MRRRKSKPPPTTPSPSPSPFALPIGALFGAILSIAASIVAVKVLVETIDQIPKAKVPASWEYTLQETDTSFPAVLRETPVEPSKPQVAERTKPPKGRCYRNEDCRSSGVCRLEPGVGGVCGECWSNTDCPGSGICNDGICGRCRAAVDCPGKEVCRDSRCVLLEEFEAPGWRW